MLYAIYYEHYDSLSQDIISTNNQNGETKIYLDEEFENFKTEYKNVIDKQEQAIAFLTEQLAMLMNQLDSTNN